jgi:hypothetical protein
MSAAGAMICCMNSGDFIGPFLQGIPIAIGIYARAFAANPWPWLLIGALLLAGLVLQRLSRRRRS